MPARTKKKRKYGKRKNPGRKKYNKKRKSARKSRGKKMPAAIKTMLAITTMSPYMYNFANLATAELFGMSRLHTWCMWNDAPDISAMHNRLYNSFSPTPNGPINKFGVGNFRGTYQIKNMSNIEVRFDIYKCMCREDMDTNLMPLNNWSTSVQFADFWNIIVDGWKEQTAAGGSTQTLTSRFLPLGISLYDINKFCSYFKILSCKRNVLLKGGGEFAFRVKDPKWRLWDGTKIFGANGQSDAPDIAFGRRTMFVCAIGTASAVVDASNNAVSTGIYRLTLQGRERYDYTGVQNSTKKSYPVINDMASNITTLSTIDLQTEEKAGYVIAGY